MVVKKTDQKSLMDSSICKFWLFGHCKLKFSCPNSHDVETCQEGRKCKIPFCKRRHPKNCFYGEECRFKTCSHLHPGKHIKNTDNVATVLLTGVMTENYEALEAGKEELKVEEKQLLVNELVEQLEKVKLHYQCLEKQLFQAQSNVKIQEESINDLKASAKIQEESINDLSTKNLKFKKIDQEKEETMASANKEQAQLRETLRKYRQRMTRRHNDNAKLRGKLSGALASLKEGLDLKQHYAKLEGGVEGKESLDFLDLEESVEEGEMYQNVAWEGVTSLRISSKVLEL